MLLSPDIRARVDHLELLARGVVEGALAGRHKSPRHGFAVEFAQHREYAPGDDIRHIDWKVFARTERYHLKQYEQETNLVAWLIVDASESMRVGTRGTTKSEAATILAGAIAHLATGQGDSCGLVAFADKLRVRLRPSGQSSQVRDILRALTESEPAGVADAGAVLREVTGSLGRRGVVFYISDCLDELDGLVAGIKTLKTQKHDVAIIQVLDPAEIDFHFTQPTLFRGLEGLAEVTTDPPAVRAEYLKNFQAHQAELAVACRSLGVDLTTVRADGDLGAVLAGLIRARG